MNQTFTATEELIRFGFTLTGHAGAPYSWTINDETPPYYEAVAVRHGYMRATANRTAFHAQAALVLPSLFRANAADLSSASACMHVDEEALFDPLHNIHLLGCSRQDVMEGTRMQRITPASPRGRRR